MTNHTRNLCKIEEIVTECLQLKKVADIEINLKWKLIGRGNGRSAHRITNDYPEGYVVQKYFNVERI